MIWIIGNKGMLGQELSEMFNQRGLSWIGSDREVDITSSAALDAFLKNQAAKGIKIDAIVNCAAYTAVDKAEDDIAACRALNTDGPANIAAAARAAGAKLIHLSTDYVFAGDGKRPYREDDPTSPTGVYGLTKRDGEIRLLAANPDSWIIRTSWLYGRYGNNFVHTMLRLMNERASVSVVNDQRGTPTWARDLGFAIIGFIRTLPAHADARAATAQTDAAAPPAGIYHYSGAGDISWYDFAQEIYRLGRDLGLIASECSVSACTSDQYPAKVKRPAYSVLDKSKIQKQLGIMIPDWQESLKLYLSEKLTSGDD